MKQNIIFWNIRSINTQKSFERLMDLNNRYHYSFIALMEPFQNPSELEQYKRRLGFDKAKKDGWEGSIILDTMQKLTIQFTNYDKEFIISMMYA
ncbi:hypothetical protein H5410_030743, partial [Solanum commersonii]